MWLGVKRSGIGKPFIQLATGIALPKNGPKWGIAQPNDEDEDITCLVAVKDDFTLADKKCDDRRPYMCFIEEKIIY